MTLKFVIVGHIDHGKSTLIGRLLFDTSSVPSDKIEEITKASTELGREIEFAFLLDYLQEEREQGITIDTTQTFFKTEKRNYVIIDAPGHGEFVKNMITGASQAEAAILIVDVTEGVKEQTKRHANILSMLGLDQIIVVVNKMDIVNYDEFQFNKIRNEVEKFLFPLHIRPDVYIPISALKGTNVVRVSKNMPWYKGTTFLESLDSLKTQPTAEVKPLIFPIQDVYKINDKLIAVGRIEAGSIQAGQTIKILPQGELTRVKSIEKFLEDPDVSYAGESIGITTQTPVFLDRGSVICEPGKEPALTNTFRANIFWMSKEDFEIHEKITIRCATQETGCRVLKIEKRIDSSSLKLIEQDAKILKNLEVGEVIIRTKNPIAIKKFNFLPELGRFVFVKGDNICAGGIIRDV